MGERRRSFVRFPWGCVLGASLLLGPACGVPLPKSDAVEISVDAEQVKQILRTIFPNLTDAELSEYSAQLDLKAALALEAELADIRDVADGLSKELSALADAASAERQTDLDMRNDGYPTELEPLGRRAFYDPVQKQGRIELSGVFEDHESVELGAAEVTLKIAGEEQQVSVECAPSGPVDLVFLVDITGSMSPIIGALRRSLGVFVDAITEKKINGTLSVVTFQDSVGVNVEFQSPAPKSGYERSPFFPPVPIDDSAAIARLQRFISRLEANSGKDTPENLAGALDFAANNVIGVNSNGTANVIGDGVNDPKDVAPFPKLSNSRRVFVAFTDAPFHADSRDARNSSLLAPFKPRKMADILQTLQRSRTTVHVSDPSWVDQTTSPTGASSEVSVDADYWAMNTGGVGEDRVAGYSLIDLDLLVRATDTGLLDILLDRVLSSSCTVQFPVTDLSASATFELELRGSAHTFSESLTPTVL
ncbi:MAG TPA: vWA domain-containing protein [Polyangiaceae bacterium]|nr:vWA domain-containing protein [Polyangiaceae bacterium]